MILEERRARRLQGVWSWFLQRASGIALIFFLGVHLGLYHFVRRGTLIEFLGVRMRLQSLFFLAVDYGLLAIVLYHGLIGVRNVVFDYTTRPTARRAVSWGLLGFGVGIWVYGAVALYAFLT